MKKLLDKSMKCVVDMAMSVANLSANKTCLWYSYQPKVPKKLKSPK